MRGSGVGDEDILSQEGRPAEQTRLACPEVHAVVPNPVTGSHSAKFARERPGPAEGLPGRSVNPCGVPCQDPCQGFLLSSMQYSRRFERMSSCPSTTAGEARNSSPSPSLFLCSSLNARPGSTTNAVPSSLRKSTLPRKVISEAHGWPSRRSRHTSAPVLAARHVATPVRLRVYM